MYWEVIKSRWQWLKNLLQDRVQALTKGELAIKLLWCNAFLFKIRKSVEPLIFLFIILVTYIWLKLQKELLSLMDFKSINIEKSSVIGGK